MKCVVLKNTTKVNQNAILIPTNTLVVLKPDQSCCIDNYNINHSYLYKSYQRKGMKIELVDESVIQQKIKDKANAKLPKTTEEKTCTEVKEAEAITEPVIEDKTEVESVEAVEKKPARRSRKSKKNEEVSEISEDKNATSESGE